MISGLEPGVAKLLIDGEDGAMIVGEYAFSVDEHLAICCRCSRRPAVTCRDLISALHTGLLTTLHHMAVVADEHHRPADGGRLGQQRVEVFERRNRPRGPDRIGPIQRVVDVVENTRNHCAAGGVLYGLANVERQRVSLRYRVEVGLVEQHLPLAA